MSSTYYYLLYLIPLTALVALYVRIRRRHELQSIAKWRESVEAGLTEPPTLHPIFDFGRCFGSGACVKACPEQAIGIINGKGALINPAHCIGHGACAPVCPTQAVKLVFGTEKRGIDIPLVNSNFETAVPGIFIAGELGGMGLIRKAAAQGQKAIDYILQRPKGSFDFDVVIIGAGPAGIAASLASKKANLKFVTVEQEDSVGGTTYHYPRNKIVMTAPMDLPLIGTIKVKEISKESLMELWLSVMAKVPMPIQYSEKMEDITRDGTGFVVRTSKTSYRTNSILLAIGRRGTPRKLGVQGEDVAKVVYRLIDPEQYRGQHVMVVGGGDSALEAALDLAAEPGTTVTLSYRGAAFSRVKAKNRSRLDDAVANNKINVMLESQLTNISPAKVSIKYSGKELELDNDAILVCAGGELPTPFLKKIGVTVESRFGT
jgi:thioredoxin reductase/NAD-dependent dihydropyrimidine dehydrogenase PreA subunit